ncbi:MAG: DUF3137 domain-containing protein [Candidatus Izimaplasma sp.]|nr:DUF3137 domain-containing protein [Candidatus Izimaplasma bacterium]
MDKDIKAFNNRKQKSEKKFVFAGLAIIIAAILFFIFTSQEYSENSYILPFFFLLVGLILIAIGAYEFNNVKKDFKNKFLSKIFKELIPNIDYIPKQGLSKDITYSSELLKRADRYHAEDYLTGRIDDIDFISSDIKLEERRVRHTKNGTQTYYVTYFSGRVFRFDFHKELVGALQVLESGSPVSRRRFKKVELESIDFNKKFKTYAENDLTAFYILTPDIMEAIFALERRHPGRIGFSFLDQQLYLALNNNKNTFELQLFRKLTKEYIDEFKQDLLVIKDIIHTLKLNNSIFKKKEDSNV